MASFAFRWARSRPILVTSSAGIFILLASLLFLITATWDADLVDRRPESLFSAGPLRGGDSISQTFESPAAFLSRAEVLVRTDATDSINEPFDLIFRLSQDSVIVRQGRVEISNIADTIQSAVWEFAPLAESLKREYSLQLVVGARASRPVFVMTALVDYLPGSAVTNGIPAPDYVDMTLLVGRQVSSIQILQSIASRIPGGLPFLVLILLALGVASGLVFAGLAQGSILLSWRLASWVILGISVVAAAVAISVNLNASTSVPEGRMAFWLGMLLPSAGPITISGPVWRVTARPRSAGKKAAIRAVTRLLGAPGSRSWFGTLADLHVVRAVGVVLARLSHHLRQGRLVELWPLALILVVMGVITSKIVAVDPGTAFGEATPFYGMPLAVAKDALSGGSLPLWDMRTGAGDPLFANPLATQFYPLSWIAFAVADPALDFMRWSIALHLVFGAIAIYWVARIIGANRLAALVAPVAYLMNAHSEWQLLNGIAGQIMALPWTAAAAGSLLMAMKRRSWAWSAVAGLCLAMLVLAGTVYDIYFAGVVMGVLALVEIVARISRRRETAKSMAKLAGLLVFAAAVMVAIAAIKLLPVMELQPISTRMGFTLEEAEIGIEDIPTIGALARQLAVYFPGDRAAVLGGILLVFAAASALRRDRYFWGLFALVVIAAWAALGQRMPLDLYGFFHLVLPGFKFNNTTVRFLNVLYFAYPLLAALGASYLLAWLRTWRWRRMRSAAHGLVALAIGLLIIVSPLQIRESIAGVNRANYTAEPVAGSINAELVALNRAGSGHDFRVYSTYVFQLDQDTVNPLTATIYGYDLVNPSNSHMVPTYQFMPNFSTEPVVWDRSVRLLSILNAKYFAFQNEYIFEGPGSVGPVLERENGVLYENALARERGQTVPLSILLVGEDHDGDFNAFEARLFVLHPDFDPLTTTVLHGSSAYVDDYTPAELAAFDVVALADWEARDSSAAGRLLDEFRSQGGVVFDLTYESSHERNPFVRSSTMLSGIDPPKWLTATQSDEMQQLLLSLPADPTAPVVVAMIEQYEPNEMVFNIGPTSRATVFVFSQMFYPGWEVEVDGEPARLFMADSLVNGVVLPPGDGHIVVFRFRPASLYLAAAITTVAILILLGMLGAGLWRRRGVQGLGQFARLSGARP